MAQMSSKVNDLVPHYTTRQPQMQRARENLPFENVGFPGPGCHSRNLGQETPETGQSLAVIFRAGVFQLMH